MLINNAVITGSFILNGVDITGITGSSAISSSYLALSSSYVITSASYAQSSASLSIRTSNLEATSSTLTSASSSFAADSASLSTRLTGDETNISTLTTASSSFAAQSASLSTRLTTDESNFSNLSSSFATTSGSISSRVTIIEGQDATTGSNVFSGTQNITDTSNAISFTSTASLYTDGGLRVAKDSYVSGTAYFNNVVVYGTSSIQYITSSQVDIGTNIIYVNTDTPAVRFGGLAVYDSGSTQLTGSMLWDSEKNHWIYSNPSGSTYSGGMIMSGPRAASLGTEQGTTSCYLMAGQGGDHITSSMIYTDSTVTCIPNNLIGSTVCSTMTNASCIGIGIQAPQSVLHVVSGANVWSLNGGCACTAYNNNSLGFYTNAGNIAITSQFGTINWPEDYTTPNGTKPWWLLGNRSGTAGQWQLTLRTGFSGVGGLDREVIGVYSTGTDTARTIACIRLSTGTGVEALKIDSAGAATFSSTITGTTIYGSTAVCSPVGKFTTCVDACAGYFSGVLQVRNTSSTPSIWSGQYGGAISILGDNATSNRYIDLSIVDSTGALATQGMRITNGGEVFIGGTTDYGDFKLQVNGNEYIKLSQGAVQTWSNSGNSSINIRTNTGYNSILSFTEEAVADRWSIGTKSADSNLYFSTGDALSAIKFTLSNSGAATFSSTVCASGFSATGVGSFLSAMCSNYAKVFCDTSDIRYTQMYMGTPAAYNPATAGTVCKIVSGISFNWYSECWLIGATRGGGADIDSFVLGRNGATNMVIGPGGNVGIGTSSPSGGISGTEVALEISNSNVGVLALTSTAASGKKYQIYSSNDGGLFFRDATAAAQRVMISCTGNVGIGTTSPASQLGVFLPSTTGGGISLQALGGATYARFGIVNPGTDNTGYIGSTSNNPFLFYTVNTERMRISETGFVGVATTSPKAVFDVACGNAHSTISTWCKNATNGVMYNAFDIVMDEASFAGQLYVQANGAGLGIQAIYDVLASYDRLCIIPRSSMTRGLGETLTIPSYVSGAGFKRICIQQNNTSTTSTVISAMLIGTAYGGQYICALA